MTDGTIYGGKNKYGIGGGLQTDIANTAVVASPPLTWEELF